MAHGHGFDPAAKLDFNLAREHHEGFGIDGVGHFLENVARTAWLWFEAFGPLGVTGLLAIVGFVAVARPQSRARVTEPAPNESASTPRRAIRSWPPMPMHNRSRS